MKKIFVSISIQLIGIICCHAQHTTNDKLEEAKNAIKVSNKKYFEAFVTGDSSIFVERYAKDCWIMSASSPTLCGEEASLDFFRTAYYQMGIRNGKFITIDVFGDGNEFVTEVGFWQVFDANKKIVDGGKFLVLWKKTEDGWRMFRDSFTSDKIR